MKRNITLVMVSLVILFSSGITLAQMGMWGRGGTAGPGMMWQGWNDKEVKIPDTLSLPKDKNWTQRLEETLASEKLSLAQYDADQERFGVYMPYAIIIPQEKNHIRWITQLLNAYGLSADLKKIVPPPVKETKTLGDAYRLGRGLESDLISNYEWLIKNAPDDASRTALGTILLQTRYHYVMFDHALQMGSFMGGGMMGIGPRR